MKKTILIPTDFSVESLNVVKSFLHQKDDKYQYDIILLYGAHLNDSISDLLFFSKTRLIESLSNKAFEDACHIIRNKYASQINVMRKDIFTGRGQAAFNNYLEANRVDEAYIPANYSLNLKKSKGFDTIPFIKNSSLSFQEVKWKKPESLPEKGKLAEIFFSNIILE